MKYTKTAPAADHVVTEDRFKILDVTSRISIKDFVTREGIKFAPGRGFYQLTKPETIQAYKEIVAVRTSDGLKVSGDKVRELLKIPAGATKFKYTKVADFDIYVQSTSYNRVLMAGTKFLYEVSPSARGVSGSPVKLSESRGPAPPPTVAGSLLQLVFSFDTTGSMYSCLEEVRKNLEAMIVRILTDIPNIRIAVFAHGDYCDSDNYITSFIDFTNDKDVLVKFVREVKRTGGGDFPECYELVLKEVREKLSWTPGSQRALVMIGDATPHEAKDYPSVIKSFPTVAIQKIDWREEADKLLGIGCRVYAVQCNSNSESTTFWSALAYKTYGYHLSLKNFSNVFDFIMAIAFKEQGAEQFEAYKQEVIKRTAGVTGGKGLNADLHALFDSLADGDAPKESGSAETEKDAVPDREPPKKSTGRKSVVKTTPAASKRKASGAAKSKPAKVRKVEPKAKSPKKATTTKVSKAKGKAVPRGKSGVVKKTKATAKATLKPAKTATKPSAKAIARKPAKAATTAAARKAGKAPAKKTASKVTTTRKLKTTTKTSVKALAKRKIVVAKKAIVRGKKAGKVVKPVSRGKAAPNKKSKK